MEPDSEVVARARDGDAEAFAELVRRYRAAVFRLALSVLGREFVPEAEDVAQEVFLKVHRALADFRGEAEFGSWVYRITFNQAVNLKSRVRFRRPHAGDGVLRSVSDGGAGPEKRFEQSDRERAVAECIETLPEVYQAALRLYYWLGASVAEAAEMLEIPEGTVKSYLHRSRQLLQSRLRERGMAND